MSAIHGADADIGDLGDRVSRFVSERLEGAPLGRTASPTTMRATLDGAITAVGLGIERSWELLVDGVLANTVGIDSERFLAFIPVSPAAASAWIDAIVG